MGLMWKELTDKHALCCLPVLNAFINEIKAHADAPLLTQYLLGKYDYYKVVKKNGNVSIQSFNIYGSNKWGTS